MNKLYNNSIKKGARIRVLATGEIGTVAEKQLIRKGGETKIYCRVKLDKKPEQDTWYFSDQLGDTKESAFITFCDNTDKKNHCRRGNRPRKGLCQQFEGSRHAGQT